MGVNAYANYLLSQSNCWTELSTDEVIMNHAVVAAAESDDPSMRIQIVDSDTNAEETLFYELSADTTTFPVTLALQVLTTNPKTDPDYQYTMDVVVPVKEDGNEQAAAAAVDAHFVSGSCDNQQRVAGRAKEIAELTIGSAEAATAGVQLVAGWAAGHEAVRLTPVFTIGLPKQQKGGGGDPNQKTTETTEKAEPQQEQHPGGKDKKAQLPPEPWDTTLLSDSGCHTPIGADPTTAENSAAASLESFLNGYQIVPVGTDDHQHGGKLYVHGNVEGSVPAQVVIGWKAATSSREHLDKLLLQSSPGASFEHGACPDQDRIAVTLPHKDGDDADHWPTLTIHKDQSITVWGLYSLASASTANDAAAAATQNVLYRTAPLELEWVPPAKEEQAAAQADDKHNNDRNAVDPQATVDRQALHELNLKQQIAQHHARLTADAEQRGVDRHPAAAAAAAQQEEPKDHHNQNNNKKHHHHHHHKKHHQQQHDHAKKHEDHARDYYRQPKNTIPDHKNSKNHRRTTAYRPKDDPLTAFTVTGYYQGMAILILVHAVVIQTCLVVSRRGKTKREGSHAL